MVLISTTVDGADHADEVEPRLLLVHYLRTRLGRTGTVIGCDTSNCGACTVLLDGLSVKSCTLLAVQADGTEITTVQGLAEGDLHPVQREFAENHALQCGYCTAGMIMSAVDLLMENTDPSEQEVRDGLEGNTYGSRSVVVGGEAVLRAARQVVDKARVIAAHLLEASPGDLEFGGGRFSVRGDPDASRTIQDVAFAAFAAHDLPPGADPVLLAEATVDPTAFSYPHGTHLCAVEVDTATGLVKVRSYVAVDDVGTVINPMIVDGQVHGGVTQGLAQALYEEAVNDAGGNLVTGSIVDYVRPRTVDEAVGILGENDNAKILAGGQKPAPDPPAAAGLPGRGGGPEPGRPACTASATRATTW